MSLSSINFQISLTTLGLCPRLTCTQTHTCIIHSAEKRGRMSYLQIYALHISHDQCVYIFEEVWARGIHQYISTVMALSVSVETLPDVIQISTGFFHGRRRVWPAILSSAYRSDLNSRNLFNTDLVLYCLLNQTHGYIPRQLKRSHPALGHCHSCFEMCGECL